MVFSVVDVIIFHETGDEKMIQREGGHGWKAVLKKIMVELESWVKNDDVIW